jgi:hypothetical protein
MRIRILGLSALVVAAPALRAQSLDLTINDYGLSIGDSRLVRGIRLNFRDRDLERVVGVNATIWTPHRDARGGMVDGLALGLPMTGARSIRGLGVGLLGVAADREFRGVGIAGGGVGTGGDARGILLGGFGVGAGRNVTGLTVGVFGAGAGGDISGITIGGFGAGAGGNVTGLTVGGFGVGSGGNVRGITIGGFGAGAGGDVTGFTFGGFGAGAGGDITGITIGGFGAGAGGTLRGLALGGIGVGAPRIRGVVVTAFGAGGHDVAGGVLAPVWFRITSDDDGPPGRVQGVTVSAFNQVQGHQYGLSLGLLNYAWELHGVQVGVLNYARNNRRGLRLLPLFNKRWE